MSQMAQPSLAITLYHKMAVVACRERSRLPGTYHQGVLVSTMGWRRVGAAVPSGEEGRSLNLNLKRKRWSIFEVGV